MYKSILQKAALILISVLLSLLPAEFVLRRFLPPDENYYVWQPNLHYVFHPDSNVLYGIKGLSQFTINELGYRGPIFQPHKPNYLCLGGRTTECLYLDNAETWPYLLGKYPGNMFAPMAAKDKQGNDRLHLFCFMLDNNDDRYKFKEGDVVPLTNTTPL